jgi:hypothetical protein
MLLQHATIIFSLARASECYPAGPAYNANMRVNIILVVATVLLVEPVGAQLPGQSKHPDFAGIWNSATATPVERTAQLKDKQFFTPK